MNDRQVVTVFFAVVAFGGALATPNVGFISVLVATIAGGVFGYMICKGKS